ncbi:acyltransferase family protein [Xanthobacteraceae bacterium A53D]
MAATAPAVNPTLRSERVACLDGLRGVAACAVVVFHFIYAFLPQQLASGRTGFGIADTPLALLWNGRFSVAIFFVLSGFVLAASCPRSPRDAPALILLRYLRLAVPALVSCILAWIWLTGFPDAGREVQAITGSRWLRWTYQAPIPPLQHAMWEGAIGAFVEGTSRFNNPLWTMRTEFLGSLLIYASYAVLPQRARVPAMVLGLLGLAFFSELGLAAFCAGALVYEFRHRLTPHAAVGLGLGSLGLLLGAPLSGHAPGPGLGDMILAQLGSPGLREVGATLVVVSILMTPALRALLERPLAQKLGELSFPLYLVHVPLICGPACALYVMLGPLQLGGLILLFMGVAAASLGLAVLFLLAVERPLLVGLRAARARFRQRQAQA